MAIELPLVPPNLSNTLQTSSSAFRSLHQPSPLTTDRDNNIFRQSQNTFIFQLYNFAELDQRDIDKREKIYMTFLTHTQKFLQSLLQYGSFTYDKSIFQGENFSVITKHRPGVPVGAWEMRYEFQGQHQTTRHSDIIALYAFTRNTSYKQAIHILSEHIERNSNLYTASQSKAGWFIQEKYPISVYELDHCNDFINGLKSQIDHRNLRFYTYKNKYDIHIATKIEYFNNSGGKVTVFYTIQRRHDSPSLYFVPISPEPPYMIYNIEKVDDNTNSVVFVEPVEFNYYHRYLQNIVVSCPFGNTHLDQADFLELTGKHIYVRLKTSFHEEYLLRLKKKIDEFGLSLSFFRHDLSKAMDINSLLEHKEYYIPLETTLDVEEDNGFTKAGEKLRNQDRKRKSILHPIIESGTITWLFSKEKVGKTLVSLAIAYAAGKGNKPVGLWNSVEAANVLYIDGEMPGDKIASLCDMIMRGYGDNAGYKGRPFTCYLFYEENLDYDSILDKDWLEKNKKLLFSYDLIILDNYYSLNENRMNVRPFIKFLKELTRQDIAVIVVDHVNAEGDLQGSQVKRRAADIGIKLENIQINEISINYEFDRYGKSTKSPDFNLQRCFYTDQVQLVPIEKTKDADKQPSLTHRDKKLLYSLVLKKNLKIKQTTIAKEMGIGPQRISEYISSAKSVIEGNPPARNKPSDTELFTKEYERLSVLSKEQIMEEFSIFCSTTT